MRAMFVICLSWCTWWAGAQSITFEKPQLLAPTVNSKADELLPVISPDGSRLYLVRAASAENMGGRFGGQDIWVCERKDSAWGKASRLDTFNNQGNNAVVGLDYQGQRIYLLNSYEDALGSKSGLSHADWQEGGWSQPVVTKIEGVYGRETNDIYGLHVNDRSDVLLISMAGPGTLGAEDLYVSFKFTGWNRFHQADPGSTAPGFFWWSEPIHLGAVINSTGFEISPFLSPDGKVLFFSSNRRGGYGNADIYYSMRLDDTWKNWSEPVNLGRTINSAAFDAYFFMAADSSVYFSSARTGGFADIYQSRLLGSEMDLLVPRSDTFETPVPAVTEGPNYRDDEVPVVSNDVQLDALNRIERNVLFDHNSANLLLKDLDVLENTVSILKANTNLEIHLVGHTDDIGNAKKNEILSERRAASVKQYLVENGIEESRIVIEGHGEDNPLVASNDEQARELNRRVELFFRVAGTGQLYFD